MFGMRELTLQEKKNLCKAFNSDRVEFVELAYEIAGNDVELIEILDDLNNMYKTPELAYGRDDTDDEEMTEMQERLLRHFGIEIDLNGEGKAFLIGKDNLVNFKTIDGIEGIAIVVSQDEKNVTLEFDPYKVKGDYTGTGLETYEKKELLYMSTDISQQTNDILKSYIQLSRKEFAKDKEVLNDKESIKYKGDNSYV